MGFRHLCQVGFQNWGRVGFWDVDRGRVSMLGSGFDFRMEIMVVIRDGHRVRVMG